MAGKGKSSLPPGAGTECGIGRITLIEGVWERMSLPALKHPVPGPKLTPAEAALMLVLCDPAHFKKTAAEVSELAGISGSEYYQIIQREHFLAMKDQILLRHLRSRINKVLYASVKYATESARNTAERKMLLEMAGLYVPSAQKVHVSAPDGGPVQVQRVGALEEKDLDTLISSLMAAQAAGHVTIDADWQPVDQDQASPAAAPAGAVDAVGFADLLAQCLREQEPPPAQADTRQQVPAQEASQAAAEDQEPEKRKKPAWNLRSQGAGRQPS